jgi:hypothetical protein
MTRPYFILGITEAFGTCAEDKTETTGLQSWAKEVTLEKRG